MAQRQLSTVDRGQAIAWLQDGAMQRNVAHRLNVSQSEKTGTSPTGHFVNVESLPDTELQIYDAPVPLMQDFKKCPMTFQCWAHPFWL